MTVHQRTRMEKRGLTQRRFKQFKMASGLFYGLNYLNVLNYFFLSNDNASLIFARDCS